MHSATWTCLTNTPRDTEPILDFEVILQFRSRSISLFLQFNICHQQCWIHQQQLDKKGPTTFPIDLGFTMTVHKALGTTIHRVFLDLFDHSPCSAHCGTMDFAPIFASVGPAKGNHTRLLGHTCTCQCAAEK